VPKKKRVAAYARVSVESERMRHSLSAQVSYYSSLIQSNPEWKYAGVFADYGISGTGTKARTEFNRMLWECEKGNIDIILTKSIQRFARNTVDLLNTVRRLKSLGIEVCFEKEQIHSLSGEGELMLSILASFAQEESRSISENCKWGIRKRFKSGEIGAANKHLLGYYYDDEKRQYVIIPEEAEIVRKMFALYLDGVSLKNICAELNGAGYRTINGCLFQEASLHKMIKNEVYAGDILRQKCHIPDPISKKKVRNTGELPMYYQTDAHEAIIDRETYARVQAEIRRRESLVPPNYPFTGKITCGICGAHFTRKKSVYKGKCTVRWICRSKKEVGRTCTSINILEEQLASAAAFVLGDDVFDADQFEMQVRAMTVLKDGSIEFQLTNGRIALWEKE
jgi:DNA invertase Pin-like site-specific DNA recombinase